MPHGTPTPSVGASVGAAEFPAQNARAAAACVMGALNEGLVGPLAPDARPQKGDAPSSMSLVDGITAFCLQAVTARPWTKPDTRPQLRAVEDDT